MPALGSSNLKLKQQANTTPFTSAMQLWTGVHPSLHIAQRASAALALGLMETGHLAY